MFTRSFKIANRLAALRQPTIDAKIPPFRQGEGVHFYWCRFARRNGRFYIMEKMTIGKFIAALRRANGMTQKELGERLYVSDKTVSRWERDECDPELHLIPAIAEIFGVTTDELLRGQRRSESAEPAPEAAARLKSKSDKQWRNLLQRRRVRFRPIFWSGTRRACSLVRLCTAHTTSTLSIIPCRSRIAFFLHSKRSSRSLPKKVLASS